jgi:hypothetical protein
MMSAEQRLTPRRRFSRFAWAALSAACVIFQQGCISAQRAGVTPEGAPVWRIECPPAGGCDEKATEVCGSDYTTLNDSDTYNVVTNAYTHQKAVARRSRVLVACMPRDDPQKRRGDAISAAEPAGATPDVRCAYWRLHVEKTAVVPSTDRLRPWLVQQAGDACAEMASAGKQAQPAE